jgi:hypothetical protein
MANHTRRPLPALFWPKVDTGGPDECWEWNASRFPNRYGQFRNPRGGNGGYAHRMAWILANGPIPTGAVVLHSCDNPPCCNPAHLFLGTQADNLADASSKGRLTGPNLRPADVAVIRAALYLGSAVADLAQHYGVTPTSILNIRDGRTWRSVA